MKYRISLAEDTLPYLRVIWMLLIIAVLFLLSLAAIKQRNGFNELQFNISNTITYPNLSTEDLNQLTNATFYITKP